MYTPRKEDQAREAAKSGECPACGCPTAYKDEIDRLTAQLEHVKAELNNIPESTRRAYRQIAELQGSNSDE